ncbi:TPA: hypothetical protein ACTXEN_001990 [Raoultella planticola]
MNSMTDITELALLVSKAKASAFTLKYISQFEPADIDSDDVDLRFEVDGIETGTNVSIVDECGQAAKVIDELVEALEKAQQRIAELEESEKQLCAANVTLDARADLAERQLAAMDSDPVAWLAIYHGEVYDEAIGITRSVVEAEVDRFGWEYGLTEIIPLYRHAQTAPGDGIEAAAKWIDQQREAYDSEHGWSDPDTGAFEFGNDAQREYSSTLEELAEGIRALHPNAGMQPAPVVPDGLLSMAASAIEDLLEHTDPNTSYYSGVWADVPGKLRAAMIAAAPQDEAKKDKPHNNFGTGARLTNHRFKV